MDSARTGRALAGTYLPPSFRCHKLLVMIVLLWLLQCCQAHLLPQIHAFETLVLARKDADAKLMCIVDVVIQRPTIVWKNGRGDNIANNGKFNVTENGGENSGIRSQLLVRRLEQEDFAVYTCEATNKEGVATATVTLATQSAPTVYYLENQVRAIFGFDYRLGCVSFGLPRPTVFWIKRDMVSSTTVNVKNVNKYWLVERFEQHDSIISKLMIRMVSQEDLGVYECYAINTEGVASASVELTNAQG